MPDVPNKPAGFFPRITPKVKVCLRRWTSIAIAVLLLQGGVAAIDVIHMKGGQKLEGIIDPERSDATRVYIRTATGSIPVPRSRIERIEDSKNISPDEREGDMKALARDYDQALIYYLSAVQADPESESLDGKIANMKTKINEREEKLIEAEFGEIRRKIEARQFDEALELTRNMAQRAEDGSARERLLRQRLSEIHIEQAEYFRNAVNPRRAEQSLRNAVAAYPEGASGYFELAGMLAASPINQMEAYRYYEEGIEHVRNDPTLMDSQELLPHEFAFGNLQLKQSKRRLAAMTFRHVAEVDAQGKFPRAMDLIVQAYQPLLEELDEDTEENRKAEEILRWVAEQRDFDSGARLILGRVSFAREDWESAIPMFEGALPNMTGASSSQKGDVRYDLAVCYRKLNNVDKAVEHLTVAIQLQPMRYDVICELGELHLVFLNFKEALGQFQAAENLDPSKYRAHLGLAEAYRNLNRHLQAIAAYKRLIEIRGVRLEDRIAMGEIYEALARMAEARMEYIYALDMLEKEDQDDPEIKARNAKVLTRLGVTSITQGNWHEAMESFTRALEERPGYAEAYIGQGDVHLGLDRLERAEACYNSAVALEPDNPTFQLKLGILYQQDKRDPRGALPYYYAYLERGGKDPKVRDWIRECGGIPPARF